MAAFFSGTDRATLQSEGSDMNHFVSLIVNNAGKYTAGVTRKVKTHQMVNEEFSYPTWGDETISANRVYTEEKEYIQWFNLNIEIDGVSNDFETEMLARIKEIRASKSNYRNIPSVSNPYYNDSSKEKETTSQVRGTYVPIGQYGEPRETNVREVKAGPANTVNKEVKQYNLFNEDDPIVDYENLKLDENIVDWVVKQTITCSAIIHNSSNIDIEKWARSMDSLYKKRFESKDEFIAFASNFADFLVNCTVDPKAADYLDSAEMAAVLAYQVREKLSKLPKNEWLDAWMELYDDYIL